jgi:uncharacterized BrkB/YihY/UPF0761 family membrane protein
MEDILAHPGNNSGLRQLRTGNSKLGTDTIKDMYSQKPPQRLRWFWIPLRVLLLTFLLALLSFAVCLLLGIIGLIISSAVRGIHPDLTLAYRDVAFPAALIGGLIALVVVIIMEFRGNVGAGAPPVRGQGQS